MVREVSESCLDSVVREMVSCYCNVFYANKPDLAAPRIEAIGYQLGFQLSERYTMERPPFSDHLEAIKFICKDFWSNLFKKQIDNLRTNHRGTFVLQDNKFRWLTRMSIDPSPDNRASVEDNSVPTAENKAAHAMTMHLYFPCGIIRGALSNLGIPCAVSADISNLPACSFVVPMIGIAMGEKGFMSRISAKFGGFLTFGSIEARAISSPGQPTIRDLLDLYNFRQIGADTKVHGVIGNPIGHSKSPHPYNAAFKSVGFDGVYLPLLVDNVSDFLSTYSSPDFVGYSYTIPHKVDGVQCCDVADPIAKVSSLQASVPSNHL